MISMRKKIFILLSAATILGLCGYAFGLKKSDSYSIDSSSQKLTTSDSASIKTVLDFKGSITSDNGDVPYLIHVTGDGVVVNAPNYQENWRYSRYMEILGTTSSSTFDISGYVPQESTDYIGMTSEKGKEDWKILNHPTSTCQDYLLSNLIEHMKKNGKQQTTDAYSSTLDGEDLIELMNVTLDPCHEYNLNKFQWTQKNVPVTIILNSDGLPKELTADCKIIGQEVAELVADKTGIRITVESFTVHVTYDDYGRINSVDLPDALKGTTLF